MKDAKQRWSVLRVGDVLLTRSGLRRVLSVSDRGISLLQIRDGRIGGFKPTKKFRKTYADGRRRTTYVWCDLDGFVIGLG